MIWQSYLSTQASGCSCSLLLFSALNPVQCVISCLWLHGCVFDPCVHKCNRTSSLCSILHIRPLFSFVLGGEILWPSANVHYFKWRKKHFHAAPELYFSHCFHLKVGWHWWHAIILLRLPIYQRSLSLRGWATLYCTLQKTQMVIWLGRVNDNNPRVCECRGGKVFLKMWLICINYESHEKMKGIKLLVKVIYRSLMWCPLFSPPIGNNNNIFISQINHCFGKRKNSFNHVNLNHSNIFK